MNFKEKRLTKKNKRDASKKKTKGDYSSDSGGEDEHELYFYAGDRVQLMKEVLKVLTSKKIKSLAPDSLKNLDMEEINTMLLEELLGISNKRLKKILDGQNADDESSSSSEDGDKNDKPIDIISLDDVSDDDLCIIEDEPTFCEKNKKDPKNDKTKNSKKHKIKKEPKEKHKIKEEPVTEKDKLLSVLELLELQARARAIRSQIALETDSKTKETEPPAPVDDDDDEDAVIVEVPSAPKEIVISSSDSENEAGTKKNDKSPNDDVINNIITSSDKDGGSGKSDAVNETSNSELGTSICNGENSDKNVAGKSDDNVNTSMENCENRSSEHANGNKSAENKVDIISDIPLPKKANDKALNEKNGDAQKNPSKEVVSGNKTDSDDDVIRLDVVEIEGIDD